MICILGDKDTVTGFNLAGVKKSYDTPKDIKDERIVLVSRSKDEQYRTELTELENTGKLIIRLP